MISWLVISWSAAGGGDAGAGWGAAAAAGGGGGGGDGADGIVPSSLSIIKTKSRTALSSSTTLALNSIFLIFDQKSVWSSQKTLLLFMLVLADVKESPNRLSVQSELSSPFGAQIVQSAARTKAKVVRLGYIPSCRGKQ